MSFGLPPRARARARVRARVRIRVRARLGGSVSRVEGRGFLLSRVTLSGTWALSSSP